MTLEEAIKHEEEIVKEEQYEYQECVATHNMEGAMNCRKYAEEHRQLAEWLKDYKRLLEQEPILDKINAEIEQEYNRLRVTRADETLELGECLGLKMSLKIIGKYKAESEE